MIIVMEGIQGSGKTSIARALVSESKFRFNLKGVYYHSFESKPSFYNNGLCRKAFQDVVFADFLNKVPIDADFIIFDRSIFSGFVYDKFEKEKTKTGGDKTIHKDYFQFCLEKFHNGVNGPLVIFYLNTKVNIAQKRFDENNRPDRLFLDTSVQYKRFWSYYGNHLSNMGIKLYIYRNDNNADYVNVLQMARSEIVRTIKITEKRRHDVQSERESG